MGRVRLANHCNQKTWFLSSESNEYSILCPLEQVQSQFHLHGNFLHRHIQYIYIYIRMCTYIIYPISCCWSCCCKSMVWEVSNGIVYLLAEGAEKVGIQRAIASGARSESLLPWARCLTGAYFLGSKKCKGCRPWMAMTNQTTNCKNEKIQCKTGCTKIAHSPYEEIINTWCFLNIHLDCIQKSWSGPCSA